MFPVGISVESFSVNPGLLAWRSSLSCNGQTRELTGQVRGTDAYSAELAALCTSISSYGLPKAKPGQVISVPKTPAVTAGLTPDSKYAAQMRSFLSVATKRHFILKFVAPDAAPAPIQEPLPLEPDTDGAPANPAIDAIYADLVRLHDALAATRLAPARKDPLLNDLSHITSAVLDLG